MRDAAIINRIVTIFKVLPILVFIVVLFFAFDAGVFADNWTAYGYGDLGGLDEQVRNTMLVTTFVFLGIEGASVYSRYAKKRSDVGRATVLGFLSVLAIFSLVTLSSYSVMPQPDLADTRQPSMVGVFESVVGDWLTSRQIECLLARRDHMAKQITKQLRERGDRVVFLPRPADTMPRSN